MNEIMNQPETDIFDTFSQYAKANILRYMPPEYAGAKVHIVMNPQRGRIASSMPICSPTDAIEILSEQLMNLPIEHFLIAALDAKGQPVCYTTAAIGSDCCACFSRANIARFALLSGAARIIILHNHPSSGQPAPSIQDKRMTRMLHDMLSMIDIQLDDSIIVSHDGERMRYYSFREDDDTATNPWRNDTQKGDDTV